MKYTLQKNACDDLEDKTREVEENVKAREMELAELKRMIDLRAEAGRKL